MQLPKHDPMPNPLLELQRLGQSPWHDNIRRDLLTGGHLARMIADGDITGLTTNPTIFEQAIANSDVYTGVFRDPAMANLDAAAIFDTIAIDDIRAAADLFVPVYERTKGDDGYVSIEVSPLLADDTLGTVAEAHRLWRAVGRPNLMVKIPANEAGIRAVEEVIAGGINVNVTLIFSIPRYEQVMAAYLRGLTRRLSSGGDVSRIASVASFFISRVDTAIDALLVERAETHGTAALKLRGKAAIANARLAYEEFHAVFGGSGFEALAAAGARKQRPLWASTSSKNPAYKDTYYVEALIGPDTVNTMPPATIAAYRNHGEPAVRLEHDLDDARRTIRRLQEVGIDFGGVLRQLENDGVASFRRSFESLLEVVQQNAGLNSGATA